MSFDFNPFEHIDFEKWFGWTYEAGGTTAHMQSVEASHYWNMEYGTANLNEGDYLDYYRYSEEVAGDLISSGQNESTQAVVRYWELMEGYLDDKNLSMAQRIAEIGVDTAKAHEGGTTPPKPIKIPIWLILSSIALLMWRK